MARALGALPLIDAALAAGRLSYSKVRALTRVATAATEAALLDTATRTTAAQLEVVCRKLHAAQRLGALSGSDVAARRTVVRRDRDDGMVVIEAVLPADEAAVVWTAIEREATAGEATADGAPHVPAGPRERRRAPAQRGRWRVESMGWSRWPRQCCAVMRRRGLRSRWC